MLVFITAVRSSVTCSSWERFSAVFRRSILSVCAQRDAAFHSIVVCHEIPEGAPKLPNLDYHPVNFPRPGTDWIEREHDKAQKLFTAFQLASRVAGATHVMIVDADDHIDNSIAAYVAKNAHEDGWYLAQGYRYAEGSGHVDLIRERFNKFCGSSHIFSLKFGADLLECDPVRDVERFLGFSMNTRTQDTLVSRGAQLKALPFPGAIYNYDHGDNLNSQFQDLKKAKREGDPTASAKDAGGSTPTWIKFFRRGRRYLAARLNQKRITPDFRAKFGLYELS